MFIRTFTLLLLVAVGVLPVALLIAGVPVVAAAVAAVFFWPSLVQVALACRRQGAWPAVSAGPGISWAGRHYGFRGRR